VTQEERTPYEEKEPVYEEKKEEQVRTVINAGGEGEAKPKKKSSKKKGEKVEKQESFKKPSNNRFEVFAEDG